MNHAFATFEELEEFFSRLSSPGIRPGLERIALLLEKLGHPESTFPAVHIVGTNGKGSTAAFFERILRSAGYSTALYTSPHLESPTERLLLNGEPLSLGKWSDCAFDVEAAMNESPRLVEDPPTFFEIVTATAFLLCARSGVDIAVVEAGLGGRLDATNLLGDVCLTLVTSISMDHMDFLGDTLEEIAAEKFAVMREGVPAFFSGTPSSMIPLFRSTAFLRGALPNVLGEECTCDALRTAPDGLTYTYRHHPSNTSSSIHAHTEPQEVFIPIHTAMRGLYQVENSALAILGAFAISTRFPKITSEGIQKGIAAARWPGRFETIGTNPPLILDGGHNPGGVEKLVESLSALYAGRKIGVVYGCMKDKAYSECLALLQSICSKLYCVSVPGNPRAASPELLAQSASDVGWSSEDISIISDPMEALQTACLSDEVVVCCGSLYLIGYVRPRLSLLKKEGAQ